MRTWLVIAGLIALMITLVTAGSILTIRVDDLIAAPEFQMLYDGSRQFIFQGIDPYSRLPEGEAGYPLISYLLFLPFSASGDPLAGRVAWSVVLWLTSIWIVLTLMRIADWRPGPVGTLAAGFAMLGNPLTIWAILRGDPVLIGLLFLTGAAHALKEGAEERAGVWMSLALLAPGIGLIPVLMMLIWALIDGRGRTGVWFAGSLVALTLGGALFKTDWIVSYVASLLRVALDGGAELHPLVILQIWTPGIGVQLGWGVAILAIGYGLWEWVMAQRKLERWFIWTWALTLCLVLWVGVPMRIEQLVVLSIPLIFAASKLSERSNGGVVAEIMVLVLWPVLLWLVVWLLQGSGYLNTGRVIWLFGPIIVLILLWWVRAWAIREQRTLLEALRRL